MPSIRPHPRKGKPSDRSSDARDADSDRAVIRAQVPALIQERAGRGPEGGPLSGYAEVVRVPQMCAPSSGEWMVR